MLGLMIFTDIACASEFPDRRRDQFSTDFGYYIYPIGGDIPGLGQATGLGTTAVNIGDTDIDFTAFTLDGDFSATGIAALNFHATDNLIIDFGYYNYDVAPIAYHRGIDSDPDDYILPRANGAYFVGQATLTYDQRRREYYYRLFHGDQQLTEVLDKNGNAFESIDDSTYQVTSHTLGLTFDYTDDHLDPRAGTRFEALLRYR